MHRRTAMTGAVLLRFWALKKEAPKVGEREAVTVDVSVPRAVADANSSVLRGALKAGVAPRGELPVPLPNESAVCVARELWAALAKGALVTVLLKSWMAQKDQAPDERVSLLYNALVVADHLGMDVAMVVIEAEILALVREGVYITIDQLLTKGLHMHPRALRLVCAIAEAALPAPMFSAAALVRALSTYPYVLVLTNQQIPDAADDDPLFEAAFVVGTESLLHAWAAADDPTAKALLGYVAQYMSAMPDENGPPPFIALEFSPVKHQTVDGDGKAPRFLAARPREWLAGNRVGRVHIIHKLVDWAMRQQLVPTHDNVLGDVPPATDLVSASNGSLLYVGGGVIRQEGMLYVGLDV